jgi:hypothetical protein
MAVYVKPSIAIDGCCNINVCLDIIFKPTERLTKLWLSISDYNERRIHSSLRDLSPHEFYLQSQKQHIPIQAVRI